jgi:hypothetical protein
MMLEPNYVKVCDLNKVKQKLLGMGYELCDAKTSDELKDDQLSIRVYEACTEEMCGPLPRIMVRQSGYVDVCYNVTEFLENDWKSYIRN